MNRSESPEEFYSTTEAAALLDVAVRTVQLWVERGVLNALKRLPFNACSTRAGA
jgi:transposase